MRFFGKQLLKPRQLLVATNRFNGFQIKLIYWRLPSNKSLPNVSTLILASAMERLSIQKPQSGWMYRIRSSPKFSICYHVNAV